MTSTIPWISRVGKWFRKWWWLFLIIPAVLIAIEKFGKFIERIFMRPNKPPDLLKDTKETSDYLNKLSYEEFKKLEAEDEKARKIKEGIDDGSPTPADIFDREIKKP